MSLTCPVRTQTTTLWGNGLFLDTILNEIDFGLEVFPDRSLVTILQADEVANVGELTEYVIMFDSCPFPVLHCPLCLSFAIIPPRTSSFALVSNVLYHVRHLSTSLCLHFHSWCLPQLNPSLSILYFCGSLHSFILVKPAARHPIYIFNDISCTNV